MRLLPLSLLMVASCSFADIEVTRSIDDWSWGKTGTYNFAVTTNDDGHVFGQYCFASSAECFYRIHLSSDCENGRVYDAKLLTSGQSTDIRIECYNAAHSTSSLLVKSFDKVNAKVRESSLDTIKFVIKEPIKRSVQFNLQGSDSMLHEMRNFTLEQRKQANGWDNLKLLEGKYVSAF